ncbi:hypothetical protein [Skermanella pratensis]|uniref:hypothetical protein n=1 Tax=Skermanella pratensis TaxID=2233999 RepID=UPI001300DCD7|nr:hypothetical protein [Skermanella pratensis]
MTHLSLPMVGFPPVDEASSLRPTSLEIIYIVGECPIQLRSCDIKPPWSHARAVLVTLTGDEAYWASRIADMIDAWETAHQSRDPFWIRAVAERIKRLAQTSNGLMIFTPPAV